MSHGESDFTATRKHLNSDCFQKSIFHSAKLCIALACALFSCVLAQDVVSVSTPEQLRAVLLEGATKVAITNNLNFNERNWPDPPVVITKQVTIYSLYRVKLDFCGSSGAPSRPLIVVAAPGSLLLQKVFLRNFLPNVPQNLTGLGPVPALLSRGGLITFRLVVFHFLPAVTSWVFFASPEDSFWAREGFTALRSLYTGSGLQLQRPSLYIIKYTSATDLVTRYSFETCYSPVDLHGCYSDNLEDTTLVYCLYTLADALRNPAVRNVRVFHDIGLDRLAYSGFKPIVVSQPKSFHACTGARPSINMENMFASVSIRDFVSFSGVRFKNSLPTNFTGWPPDLPVLPSMFDVSGSGVLSLNDTIVDVPDLSSVVARLKALPGCCFTDPSRPNLQPSVVAWPSTDELASATVKASLPYNSNDSGVVYDAWRPSTVGGGETQEDGWLGLTIAHWVLEHNAWQQYAAGRLNAYEALNSPSAASWRYDNVVIRQADNANARALCFSGALEQGAIMRSGVKVVADELQLRAALIRGERFVQVVSDIKLTSANWPAKGAALVIDAGIIEVRGCHPEYGKRFTIDLSDLVDVVRARGRLIFQGDLRFTGVGWTAVPESRLLEVASGANDVPLLGAFSPGDSGTGSIECESVVIDGAYSPTAFRYQDLLTVLNLNHMTSEIRAFNASLRDGNSIMLGFWSVPQTSPVGQWTFTSTVINWALVSGPTGSGVSSSAAPSPDTTRGAAAPIHIIIPIVIVGALILAALPLTWRLYHRRRKQHGGVMFTNLSPFAAAATGYGDGISTASQIKHLDSKSAAAGGVLALAHVQTSCGDATDSGAASVLAAVLQATHKLFISNGNSNGSASGTRTDVSVVAAVPVVAVPGKSDQGGAVACAGGGLVPACERNDTGPTSIRTDVGGSRIQGPLGDINAAKRDMVVGRSLPSDRTNTALDDLVLQSVLGEGSYGRVYRALWRGTTVAVKVILLPAHMGGRERYERMAVMEAAISSSLSHPNIVQTFTFGVECVEGAKARSLAMRLAGPDAHSGLPETSTVPINSIERPGSGAVPGGAPVKTGHGASGDEGDGDGGDNSRKDIVGWEIRLVQEYCDLGSLRDKLNAKVFFKPASVDLDPSSVGCCGNGQAVAAIRSGGDASPPPLAPLALRRTVSPVIPAAFITESPPGAEVDCNIKRDCSEGVKVMAPNGGGGMGCEEGDRLLNSPVTVMIVDLAAVLDTAIDVARALAHMHREGIVHADLKPRNVLLKGSTTDPRGFVAKVADFGLSMRLDHNETHVSNAYRGTLAYMAPETLLHGHVSRASDVYGFGILLYELYTGDVAFRGVPKALIGHAITKENLRPVFSPALGAPFEYQLLACRCWESNPEIRPEFDFILEDLKRMRVRLCAIAPNASSYETMCRLSPGGTGGVGGIGEPRAGGLWGLPSLPQFTAPSTQPPHVRPGGGFVGVMEGDHSLSSSNSVSMSSLNALTGLQGTVASTTGAGGAGRMGVSIMNMSMSPCDLGPSGGGARVHAVPYPACLDVQTGGMDAEESSVEVRSL